MAFFKTKREGIWLVADGRSHAWNFRIPDVHLREFFAKWNLEHILAFPEIVVVCDATREFGVSAENLPLILSRAELDWAATLLRHESPALRKIIVARSNKLSVHLGSLLDRWEKESQERLRNRPPGGDSSSSHDGEMAAITMMLLSCG